MKNNKLTPEWLIGFIEGDGYLGLERINRKRNNKIDVYYRPVLAISQKNPMVLYKIKSFIGCGSVTVKGKDKKNYHYRIRSLKQFVTFLYPILKNPFFQTNKQLQFDVLVQAITFLIEDYKPQNVNHQMYLEALDKKLRQQRFVDYCNNYPISWDWFVGFFEAEGTFYFELNMSRVRFLLKVTQKNKPLLMKIQQYFGYGTIQKERNSVYCFQIASFSAIEKKLFPLLEKTLFHSQKNVCRIKWLKVCRLIIKLKQTNSPLLEKDVSFILKIKQSLNESS
jgi:LAGLIDADG endonuclease